MDLTGKKLIHISSSGGMLNSEQISLLAQLCQELDIPMKFGANQSMALVVAEESIGEISTRIQSVGLEYNVHLQEKPKAFPCVGALCGHHEQDINGLSIELASMLSQVNLSNNFRVGINACAKSCVNAATMDISIVAEKNGFKFFVGGKSALLPELAVYKAEGVPADSVVPMVKNIVDHYVAEREEAESFHDFIERTGDANIIKILMPYSRDVAGEDDLDIMRPQEESPAEEDNKEEFDLLDLVDEDMEEKPTEQDDTALIDSSENNDGQADSTDSDFDLQPDTLDDLESEQDEIPIDVTADSEEIPLENDQEEATSDSMDGDNPELLENPDFIASDDIEEEAIDGAAEVSEEKSEDSVAAVHSAGAATSESEMQSDAEDPESDFEQRFDGDLDATAKISESLKETDEQTEIRTQTLDQLEKVPESNGSDDHDGNENVNIDDIQEDIGDTFSSASSSDTAPSGKSNLPSGTPGGSVKGVNLGNEGTLVVHFGSGASITIDPNFFSPGESRVINMDSTQIVVQVGDNGLHVISDGVGFYIPRDQSGLEGQKVA